MHKTSTRKIDDHIILRPFPLYATKDIDFEEAKRDYRRQMVDIGGIAVFVMGNKVVNGETKIAVGVIEEFELAANKGLNVIPIGATGYASEELWKKVIKNFEVFYPNNKELKEHFELLGSKEITSDEIFKTVCKIIIELKEMY